MSHSDQDRTPVEAALELYTALRGSRLSDIAALATPDVLCRPTLYHGHRGCRFPAGLGKMHGDQSGSSGWAAATARGRS